MNELIVSLVAKNDFYAVVLMRAGRLVSKQVGKVDTSNIYEALLLVLKQSMGYVRNYIEENKDCENICFELNNSTLIKWLDDISKTKEEYADLLEELHDVMNEIPMVYRYIYNTKPISLMYCNTKYYKENDFTLSVLDNSELEDEDKKELENLGELEVKVNKTGTKGMKLESLF